MAWEERNGRRYFYISQRDGNRVRRIYVGKGDVGKAAEITLAARKEQRELQRNWLRTLEDSFAAADLIDARLNVELAAVLLARAGIYLDVRISRTILRVNREPIMEERVREATMPLKELAAWEQLSERASRGDREAAAALIPLLDTYPQLVSRWGDVSRHALGQWIEIAAGQNELTKKAIHAQVLGIVSSVRRLKDDVLEETMARRIGLLWLQANYFDSQAALATKRTLAEQKFLTKRQKDAQQLYQDAVKALREYQSQMASI